MPFDSRHKPPEKNLGKKLGRGFRNRNGTASVEQEGTPKWVEEKCSGPWSIRLSETTRVTDFVSTQRRKLLQDLHVFSS